MGNQIALKRSGKGRAASKVETVEYSENDAEALAPIEVGEGIYTGPEGGRFQCASFFTLPSHVDAVLGHEEVDETVTKAIANR